MSERIRIALLLSVGTLIYGNTLLNSFTLDDNIYVLSNPSVTSFSVAGLFQPIKYNSIFRPVTVATLALNWALGADRPFGYHLFNLLLHGAATLLLYLALRKLLEAVPRGTVIAWAAALLFAVHPIHTEAVASIPGRSEALALLFLLAAWLLHLYDRPILSMVCFALAVLSKESAVVFVPLVIIGDYACSRLKPFYRYASITAMAAVYLALLWKVQGGRFGESSISFLDNPLAHLPFGMRVLNAISVAWKYAGLHVFPATLSCDYSYNAITLYSNWRHTAPGAVAAVLAVGLWIWTLATRRGEWALAGAIYLAGFAVTANILVPTGTIMGERLAYLPSAGFCLLVALIWIRLEIRYRDLAWVALVLLVAALAARTVLRNRDWRNEFTLFSAGVRAVPGSAKMHADLGLQYYFRDQIDEAGTEIQTALRIYPDFPDAMGYYALVLSRNGNDQEARRLLQLALSKTLVENVNYDFIAINLAAVQMKLGQNDDALKVLNEEIARSPKYSRAWSNRAVIWYLRGDTDSARSDAQNALRLSPSNLQAQNLLNMLGTPVTVAPQR